MRYEETGIRITDDAVLAHNAAGEVIKVYPKRARPSTLYTLRSMGDITTAMYEAGIRYAQLYEAAGRAPKYAGGDPTNPKVDGSGSAPDELSGNVSAQATLYAIRDEAIGERGMAMLDEICGRDITMTDYRDLVRRRWQAVRRELNMHLDRLDHWFRKVRSDSKRA